MSFFKNKGIKISGITSVVPANRVEVESFSAVFGEEIPARFSASTGIKAMYKALPQQTASDLATAAAENLIERKGIDRKREN